MNLFALFQRNPGRDLARIGADKRKQSVREKAQEIRRELGLPPHPALGRAR
jgi:hypothetical protein